MPGENSSETERPFIDTERISKTLNFYKFPLIFGGLGIILLLAAIVLLTKNLTPAAEVQFTSGATSSAQTKLKVDMEGAVLVPGVYELAADSRISDALASAGGLSAEADRDWVAKNLNLAAKVTDGGKIYIPEQGQFNSGEAVSGLSSNQFGVSTSKTLNINSASQLELEALPGIGPVTAGKIINGRPYNTVEELKTKKVLGNSLFEKIKDSLTVY